MKESAQERSLEVAARDSSAPPARGTHTPTPWEVFEEDEFDGIPFINITAGVLGTVEFKPVCHVQASYDDGENDLELTDEDRANAAFIVKATNSHDALVKALRPFGNFPDFFDIEDEDTVIYQNGCGAITVGDLRCAQALLSAISRS